MARIFQFKIALLLFVFITQGAVANTIVAEPNNPQKTIKKAFEKAKNGDTVFIKKGIYREGSLTLNKAITIIGENYPEIDGQNKHENLLVQHDNVVIKNVLFSNSGSSSFKDIASLKIKDSKNIRIENCKFKNNFFGIHTTNSTYVSYINNQFNSGKIKGKPSANGIHIWKSKFMTIEGNIIQGHRDAIYLEFVESSTITKNQSIENKRYGLHFMFSHDNIFKNNIFKKNEAGVAVMYSKNVEMIENVFTQSWGGAAYGVLLKEINDSKIIGNEFSDNTIAIYGDGANRIEIRNNKFLRNGWALKMNASSSDAVITNNNFLRNTFDVATNGKLKVKSFNGNYWDKYEGYDLDKDGIGDVPYHPLSLFTVLVEKNSAAMLLYRSFMITLLDKSEKVLPSITPDYFKDEKPLMRSLKL
ncbi:MAG: nitrous oxide reductase family maturation protein NosD [Flavobacterium sp.]|uniref:nitrous oxide reductase family maturation protein NosD n=1 Tax=Flavobacterium sp. TaxID=239 RepID=UPI002FC9BB73